MTRIAESIVRHVEVTGRKMMVVQGSVGRCCSATVSRGPCLVEMGSCENIVIFLFEFRTDIERSDRNSVHRIYLLQYCFVLLGT